MRKTILMVMASLCLVVLLTTGCNEEKDLQLGKMEEQINIKSPVNMVGLFYFHNLKIGIVFCGVLCFKIYDKFIRFHICIH